MQTNSLSIQEQLLYTTIKINSIYDDGSTGSGTGFFFKYEINNNTLPFIVTNKHVVENNIGLTFNFKIVENNQVINNNFKVTLPKGYHIIPHPSNEIDLCLIPLAPIFSVHNNLSVLFFGVNDIPSITSVNELLPIEEIIMIGYPIGLSDEYNNLPITRRGITATPPYNDYNNKKEFLIDAACFPGSSGSPVFIFNQTGHSSRSSCVVLGSPRLIFLGILWGGPIMTVNGTIIPAGIPIINQSTQSQSNIPINLGFVLKSSLLLDFKPLMSSFIPNN